MFGTQFPPYYAGRFYQIGRGRKFFLFSNKNNCITLRMKDFRYKEIVVEVSHKEKVAKMIRNPYDLDLFEELGKSMNEGLLCFLCFLFF